MTKSDLSDLIERLETDRDWRNFELQFCKNIPILYVNSLFQKHSNKYWRMCVPIIYAHWEGFVVNALRELVDFINAQNLRYSSIKRPLILLSNKNRFKYLQGNICLSQQNRFLDELFHEMDNSLNIERICVSANSNLNFEQFKLMISYFDMQATTEICNHKNDINKLVEFRNRIAHGENSIVITQDYINKAAQDVIQCIDEVIVSINNYVNNESYLLIN